MKSLIGASFTALLLVSCSAAGPAQADQPATRPAAPPAEGFALTVYSTADPAFDWANWNLQRQANRGYYGYNPYPFPGYGVVRETRRITLEEGRNAVRFTGVAASIDPTTLQFRSFTDPGASVLEQGYEYDLLDAQKLLEKYVGKTLQMGDSRKKVKLLSVSNGTLVYQEIDEAGKEGPIRMQPGSNFAGFVSQLEFTDTAGMILEPTLVWDLLTERGGEQLVQVTYEAQRMTWRADYTVVTNANDTAVDVGSWVTLINESGLSYPETRLKLIAGDVQRVTPAGYAQPDMAQRAMDMAAKAGAAGFEEKSFFEYHLYTLGRPTSLAQNSTKQIELFPTVMNVPAEKIFVYYGLPNSRQYWFTPNPVVDRGMGIETNKSVDIYLKFKNAEKSGMGIPLPAGKLRVYKKDDADDTLEFIGEDVIWHTPREEDVLVRLGSAFDLVGERIQKDFRVDYNAHWMEEDIEVKLRNRKREPASILVKENLYRWVNWEITKKSHEFEKQDSRTIHFNVPLQPDEEATLTYTVRYTW
jgi:hypothetical protein